MEGIPILSGQSAEALQESITVSMTFRQSGLMTFLKSMMYSASVRILKISVKNKLFIKKSKGSNSPFNGESPNYFVSPTV